MQVAQYLFQSPYTSSVQVGILEPSSSQNQGTVDTNAQSTLSSKAQAKEVTQTQTQAVQPSTDINTQATRLLDVVA
jgi:hypothetical protein